MASSSSYSPFSAVFDVSKPNPSLNPTAFLVPSLKFSTAISNFANLSNGFSLKSPINPGFLFKSRTFNVQAKAAAETTVHNFTVNDIDGNDVSLNKYKGKVMLIVNVASRWTTRFEILAFPCNQFGGQEPGSNPEIKQSACTRFKAEFPIFDKVDVNGPSTAPIYQFLKSNAGGFLGDLIKWNFEKFLIDKKGKVVERYPPTTSLFQIKKDIKKLLDA
ncbi:hypothetical protein Bca101_009995 [Brassica carinata]